MSKLNTSKSRDNQVKDMLMAILRHHGIIYTMGMLIGLVSRISRNDYMLYKEIVSRYEHATGDTVD